MLRIRALYILLLLPLFCLAQQDIKEVRQFEDTLSMSLNATYPISYLINDSVTFTNKVGVQILYDMEEVVEDLLPQLVKIYQYTNFTVTKDERRDNVYGVQNCGAKHEIIEKGGNIVAVKEIRTGNYAKCLRKPQIKNIEKSTDPLENTVAILIKAFAEKDSETVNKFIHKDKKLIVLYKIGVPGVYSFIDRVDFDNPEPVFWIFSDYTANYMLHKEDVPAYDCVVENWTKPAGLYCRPNKDNLLTDVVRFLMKYEDVEVSEEEFQSYIDLELSSYKVVLAGGEDSNSLVFYLTLIDGKWYMTILDGLSTDCSA